MVPSSKVLGSGVGGTISSFVIDIFNVRLDWHLTSSESDFIIVLVSMLLAWAIPDTEKTALEAAVDSLRARLEALSPRNGNGQHPAYEVVSAGPVPTTERIETA